jgi:hypothetical protein
MQKLKYDSSNLMGMGMGIRMTGENSYSPTYILHYKNN